MSSPAPLFAFTYLYLKLEKITQYKMIKRDLLKNFYLQVRPHYNIPNYDIKSVLYCQTHCIQQTINQFWTIRTSKHSSWKMVFCYYYIACPFGANSHLLFTTTTRHTQLLAVADIHTYNKSRAPKTSNPPS